MADSVDSVTKESAEESEESSEGGGKEAGERGESNTLQSNLDSNPDDVKQDLCLLDHKKIL